MCCAGSASPLAITLSSYNYQVTAVADVERLFDFRSTGGHSHLDRRQVTSIIKGFRQGFFRYLNGVGHVWKAVPGLVSEEEYRLCRSDSLFRAKAALRQLTDSWLLPVGGVVEGKITVRLTASEHRPGHKYAFRSFWNLTTCLTTNIPRCLQLKSQLAAGKVLCITRNGFIQPYVVWWKMEGEVLKNGSMHS